MDFGTGDLNENISTPGFHATSMQYRYAVPGESLAGMDVAENTTMVFRL